MKCKINTRAKQRASSVFCCLTLNRILFGEKDTKHLISFQTLGESGFSTASYGGLRLSPLAIILQDLLLAFANLFSFPLFCRNSCFNRT